VEMTGTQGLDNSKVVVITNLTRNVVETHLKTIFSFYGEITKVDLPLYVKCTWNMSIYSKIYDKYL
jgi:hypothetical protein